MSAQGQLLIAVELLKDGGKQSKYVMDRFVPVYPSKADYFEAVNQLLADRNLVVYTEGGATVSF